MSIFSWLVQAAYDTGQAAIAARKYDGQAAARLRQASEICLWNADHIRPYLSWAEPKVIEFPDCPIKSQALSTDEAKLDDNGFLTGSLRTSMAELLQSLPLIENFCKIAPGTTGILDLESAIADIDNMLEMSFTVLITSGMNCIGRKLAIQEGKNFEPEAIINNFDQKKPILYFCTVCGRNFLNRLEEDKCYTCGSGWNSMELWPKE